MTIKRFEQIEPTSVPNGEGVTRRMLISPEEGPHFAMRAFRIEAGGGMPMHTNQVEHEQYVLRGRGRVVIGDEVSEVSEGAIVFIPANVPHSYTPIGDEAFEFLCLVPNLPDQTIIVDQPK
jgi:quercetin dioxygenase-like cupin family protein